MGTRQPLLPQDLPPARRDGGVALRGAVPSRVRHLSFRKAPSEFTTDWQLPRMRQSLAMPGCGNRRIAVMFEPPPLRASSG